jgi:hypothetical protein
VTAAPAPTSIISGPPGVVNAAEVKRYAGQRIAVSTLTEGSRDFADRDDAKAARFTADTGVQVQFVRHTFSDVSDVLKLYQGLLEARSSDIDVLHIDVIWPGPLANICSTSTRRSPELHVSTTRQSSRTTRWTVV